MWYRFGAGPGPWQPLLGPVVIPPGKQLLSAVLVAPGGAPGPVTTLVARSDVHASAATRSPDSQADYSGETSATGAVTVSVLVARQLGTVVRRIGGTTRYGTGAAISAAVAGRRSTVIIATGENFPDALTASGLAGCLDAPVLLVRKSRIPPETASEIRRLKAKRAIICGGPPAVSETVAKKLRGMGLSVERLAGKTRYETAVAVSKRIQKLNGGTSRVFIARGTVFSDALIVAPLAYKSRAPILLSGSGTLYPSTAYRLTAARYSSATLIGGGLSSRVESGVKERVRSVGRWAGANQYDTAVQVAANSVLEGSLSWGYVGIARGDIFPDALCGGALCGKKAGVILLTPSKSLHPSVANALQAHMSDVARCEIYGSDKAVTAAVFNQINAIFR
jgi:putative cell wall-binding protein